MTITARINELREKANRLENIEDVFRTLEMNMIWNMNIKKDEDGNELKDENNEYIYIEPDRDAWQYDRYFAYKWALDVLTKAVEKI